MKRILCILFLLLAFTTNCFAAKATIQANQDQHNLELNYPVVTLEDPDASEEINRYITKNMSIYKKVFEKHNYQFGRVEYEIMYEDDDYLSMVFTFWWYYKNAVHGMYNKNGIIFDKHTGKLVNLKHFVPDLNLRSLVKNVKEGNLPVYNAIFEPHTIIEPWEIERVSHSYYIDQDKSVFLIYQPYELAPYALGNTYIKITQEQAQKLKD